VIDTLLTIREYIDIAAMNVVEALDTAENADKDLVTLPAFIEQARELLERIQHRVDKMVEGQP
jgi:hypothetical protein